MSGLANAGGLLAGLLAGAAHFALLRQNVRLYLRPGSVGWAIGLQALRLVLLAGVLVVLVRQGALPLLLGSLGVLLARPIVLRRMTEAAP